MGAAALRYNIPRTALALTTLAGHTRLKLDVIKAHARTRMPCNFAVRYSAANTNDHGGNL
jgi:hypothetical protein